MSPNEGRHFWSRNEDDDVFRDLQGAPGPPFWSHLGLMLMPQAPFWSYFGVAKRGRGRAAGVAEDHCSSQHSFETISLQPSIFKRASRSLAKTGL